MHKDRGSKGDAIIMAAEIGAKLANFREFGVVWMPGLSIPGETYDDRPHYRSQNRNKGLPGSTRQRNAR